LLQEVTFEFTTSALASLLPTGKPLSAHRALKDITGKIKATDFLVEIKGT
jgi:hypothetical protein